MTREREPREGVERGGGVASRLGSQGDAASGRLYERGFSPGGFFPLFFSEDERENRVAVLAQADFVTHVLPSVT